MSTPAFTDDMNVYEIELQARRLRGAFMGELIAEAVARFRALLSRTSGAQHA